MDPSILVACFDASFSPDANTRMASELELKRLERLDGMPSAILHIIAEPATSSPVRQAAAVYLKNRISRNWSEPSSSSSDGASAPQAASNLVLISEGDRHALKSNILQVLVGVQQQNVKVQLKTCLATMTGEDFPEKWNGLLETVMQLIQSGHENQMDAGLLTLVEIMKIYRYRRHEREIPNQIAEQVMPVLVNIGQQLLAATPLSAAPEPTGHLLHLIAKAYKISIVADLSPHQASQQSIVQWGTFLLQIVCRVIPEEAQPQDKDEREKWSWWKAKKWAHHVLNRLYNTYGSPAHLPSSRTHLKPFAQNFESHFAPEIFKSYLRCIEGYVGGHIWMSRRCCRFVLEFLEDCVKPKKMWQLLQPHLDLLISRFVFPCMCLTDEEVEQFDEDPVEYCRAHFGDFVEDWFSSPITAAISFLQVLAKLRKSVTLMPLLNNVNQIVAAYPAERSAREKDGALRMLSCLAPLVVKTKGIGNMMQDFFISYVFPEFSSKVGHLRVRALDMVEKFEEADMEWPDSKRLTEMFNMVMVCVTDEALPVRVQAALALPELVRYNEVREGLGPNVGRLMQELLKLSEETDIDALSKPTRALVTTFPDELLPFATDISSQMRDSYLRLINEIVEMSNRDPDQATEGVSESDEKTLVAMNILQTLETLLRSVSTAPPIVAQLETILLPVLSISLQHELVELYDELFELAHSITYFQRSISNDMWRFFEQLYGLVKGSGIDFIEELNNVFDNYVSYGGEITEEHKSMLLEIFELSMSSEHLGANDRVSACKLAGQTLLCQRVGDARLERYVSVAISVVNRKDSAEEPIVTKELYANAVELVVTAIYYDPRVGVSVGDAFLAAWFKELPNFTRVHDRKIGILAIIGLMRARPDERLLQAALTLFEGLPAALDARKAAEDEFGREDDDEDDEDDEDIPSDGEDEAEVDDDEDEDEGPSSKSAKRNGVDIEDLLDGDSDEDDDDFEDEEGIFGSEQLFETPLDKLDTYKLFTRLVQDLQLNPAPFESIIAKANDGGEKIVSKPYP